jgi:hypothetical protein
MNLPSLRPCFGIAGAEGQALVTVAGFEDRRLAACRLLQEGSQCSVLIFRYLPRDSRNDEHSILAELSAKNVRVGEGNFLVYDRFDPGPFPDLFAKWLVERRVSSVILDVSAMSKLLLLLCLDVCREIECGVSVFYAEAMNYAPSLGQFERARHDLQKYRPSIDVYTGVHGIMHHSRFSSVAMQGQPTAAIAFMSFNEKLTQALLNDVSPSRLFLINGRPPLLGWRETATAWIHEKLRKEWPESDNRVGKDGLPTRVTSTLQYTETVHVLLNLYWDLSVDHRILVAPTGSKMQTLAVFIAKRLHPDIHIEYPTPSGFLDSYSGGIGQTWMVDFGRLSQVLKDWKETEKKARLFVRQA